MTEPRVEETRTFDFTGLNDDAHVSIRDNGDTFTLTWGEAVALVREYFVSGRAFDDNATSGQDELLPVHPSVAFQYSSDQLFRELELYAEGVERVNKALRRAITAKAQYNSLNTQFDKYMAEGI